MGVAFPTATTSRHWASSYLALAYLRYLAENDYIRSTITLNIFQRFWNNNSRFIVPTDQGLSGVPPSLAVTGGLEQPSPGTASPTQNALVFSLWQQGDITDAQAASTADDSGAHKMRQLWAQMVAAGLPLGGGSGARWVFYNAGLSVPQIDAGSAIENKLQDVIDGLDPQVDLAMAEALQDVHGSGWGQTEVGPFQDPFRITAHTLSGSKTPLWVWGVGIGVLALAAGGLAYKMKKRRRR